MPSTWIRHLSSLESLLQSKAPSWTTDLRPDPMSDQLHPNQNHRAVKGGHFVRVEPTPLSNPYVPSTCLHLLRLSNPY
jgi:hypothetical protein